MVIRGCSDDRFHYLIAKTALADVKGVKSFMDEQWKALFPDELPRTFYMDEQKVESKEVNANIKYLFIFLALVAALLSVIGLFSMVSMNINKRLKEIGVRKILGAPLGAITMGISREFIIILAIACALGMVGGYYLAKMLMESIWTYYTPITAAIFVFATVSLILVCAITVGRIIYRAASVIPVHLLQD
ncbi:MAG: FtsX-like permease family protein, partial [Saprospiraceae bacterium]|nr:FtsX-like permease family protein [Saprospiraceae bacterium]